MYKILNLPEVGQVFNYKNERHIIINDNGQLVRINMNTKSVNNIARNDIGTHLLSFFNNPRGITVNGKPCFGKDLVLKAGSLWRNGGELYIIVRGYEVGWNVIRDNGIIQYLCRESCNFTEQELVNLLSEDGWEMVEESIFSKFS